VNNMDTFKVIAVLVAIAIFTWGFWPNRKANTIKKIRIKAYSSRYYSWFAFVDMEREGLV